MWPSTDRLFGYEQIRHLYWSTNVFFFFVFSSQHGAVTTLQIIASKKSLRTIVAVRTFLSPKPLNSRQCVRAHRQDCRRGGLRPQMHTEIPEHKHRASLHISTVADCFFFASFKLEMRLWSTQMVQKCKQNRAWSVVRLLVLSSLHLSGCHYLCF